MITKRYRGAGNLDMGRLKIDMGRDMGVEKGTPYRRHGYPYHSQQWTAYLSRRRGHCL